MVASCQATELLRATTRSSRTSSAPTSETCVAECVHQGVSRAMLFAAFRKLIRIGGYRIWVWFTIGSSTHSGSHTPNRQGTLTTTPTATLNLHPAIGSVRVRRNPEDGGTRNRNRGLISTSRWSDFAGKKYRVLQKVEKIINERTGKMIRFSTPGDARGRDVRDPK